MIPHIYLLAIDWFFILEKLLLIGLIITLSMVVAMYATYGERKIAAFLQDRIGPNRAGIFGLLQAIADAVKLISKETVIPSSSNIYIFLAAPIFTFLISMVC